MATDRSAESRRTLGNEPRGDHPQRILATRELSADPDYQPKFVNYPLQFTNVEIELSEQEHAQLQRLRFADYQDDAEIIREAIMRWVFRNRTKRGKLKQSVASK
jgi:hypothetical protein